MKNDTKIRIVESAAWDVARITRSAKKEAARRGFEIDDDDYDVVMAIGGDGTLMKAVKLGKPVMAVRGGKRNYLLDIKPDKIGNALDMLLHEKYKKERYRMLDVRSGSVKTIAFNETGILSRQPQTILFDVTCMNHKVSVEGDGALVATAQGSTAWSFSVRGTYLDKRSNAFIVTMLNPLITPLRSMVVPEVPITIEMLDKGYKVSANLIADGFFFGELEQGDKIHIKKSRKEAVVLKFFDSDPIASLLYTGDRSR